jgi:membrane protease YdiL (CAAX protease family)
LEQLCNQLRHFLGGPVNEEPGWRGFALPRLQHRYGHVWTTVILGPLWAAWHLPLFQVSGWSRASPWQFFLLLLGVCFLLPAAANLAKFAVLVALVLHAFFNTSSGLVKALTHDLPPPAVSDGELYTGGLGLWDRPWSHHSRHPDQHAKICLTLT